jgi:hypothetical protein
VCRTACPEDLRLTELSRAVGQGFIPTEAGMARLQKARFSELERMAEATCPLDHVKDFNLFQMQQETNKEFYKKEVTRKMCCV